LTTPGDDGACGKFDQQSTMFVDCWSHSSSSFNRD